MKKRNILVLAYYSYRDPVFQSAVLPYFLDFPQTHYNFVLLTFEHQAYPLDQSEIKEIEIFLLRHRITWKRTQWRSGTWKVIKKMIDLIAAIFISIRLIKQNGIRVIYSEGFPGAILGHYVSVLTNCKHIVHSFEPHADYMTEAGVWTKNSWETRVLRWHELRVARRASLIFTATQLMITRLASKGINPNVLWRVPSCVDLSHFKFSAESRIQIRKELGIHEASPVIVYLGKFGGMYMENEAFEFFKICQDKLSSWIFILSPDPHEKIMRLAFLHGLDTERLIVKFLSRENVPGYLSAADAGFVAVRQWPSKKYCSPIKTGEYLACGLPVIVPYGISDDVEIMVEQKICIPLKSLSKEDYLNAIKEWQTEMSTENVQVIRTLARAYVTNDRSIDRYKELYARLLDTLFQTDGNDSSLLPVF